MLDCDLSRDRTVTEAPPGQRSDMAGTGSPRGAAMANLAFKGFDPGDKRAAIVVALEEAGRTLLAMDLPRPGPRLAQRGLDHVREQIEAYGWQQTRMRPPLPCGVDIDRMDEVLGWIRLIPDKRPVLRRIVGLRALVDPVSGLHRYPWRALGRALGADYRAVQRWHGDGIDLIALLLPDEFIFGGCSP